LDTLTPVEDAAQLQAAAPDEAAPTMALVAPADAAVETWLETLTPVREVTGPAALPIHAEAGLEAWLHTLDGGDEGAAAAAAEPVEARHAEPAAVAEVAPAPRSEAAESVGHQPVDAALTLDRPAPEAPAADGLVSDDAEPWESWLTAPMAETVEAQPGDAEAV